MENYPKEENGRLYHVLYPVAKDGKWRAAEVVEHGYLNPFEMPFRTDFSNKGSCMRACTIHNNFHGWTPEQVEEIVSWSMGLKKQKQKTQ